MCPKASYARLHMGILGSAIPNKMIYCDTQLSRDHWAKESGARFKEDSKIAQRFSEICGKS